MTHLHSRIRGALGRISGDLADGRNPNVQISNIQRAINARAALWKREANPMRIHATVAAVVTATAFAATPACAAKITVSQYGRLVATLPWAVALEKGMFKEAGLDIDGITAGAGGGGSVGNIVARELPFAVTSPPAALAGALGGVGCEVRGSVPRPHQETYWAGQ